MFIKPKDKESELNLLCEIIIMSGLSKVYSEKLYTLANDSRNRVKQLINQTMNANDLLVRELDSIFEKQNEPFRSVLIDLRKSIDDSVYDDYFEQLNKQIKKAFDAQGENSK